MNCSEISHVLHCSHWPYGELEVWEQKVHSFLSHLCFVCVCFVIRGLSFIDFMLVLSLYFVVNGFIRKGKVLTAPRSHICVYHK